MSELDKVKELRKATGAGFKDCNNALKESNGNIDKAIEILRVKGISKASKKMSREANEGIIAVSGNSDSTSLIEINCETDFVAKNLDFINFAKEISAINHKTLSNKENLLNEKMHNGKIVKEALVDLISKIGEKITLGRAKTINYKNAKNYIYQHSVVEDNLSKLAVVISIITENKSSDIDLLGKQLSMHIAASNPLSIETNEMDNKLIENEKKLIFEELKNTGKPDNIIEKISKGKLQKFIEDNSLLSQNWVMDPKKKVNDILKETNVDDLQIREFVRFKIGE